ncbi:DUF3846 domain-containing protein [Pseudonocardia sp. ICBG162]|uniref:DUF3846 domain-containing protein n=1 Tax=Pseudonocardia sp. ICBG162 TaxID=2846761 RepID=UPI001CF69375|nr:DUF3846 domain-containing protein [Pseudonocardia sp. ICBG162]
MAEMTQVTTTATGTGQEKLIRGVLVTTDHHIRDITIPAADTLGGMYELLGCQVVERVTLAETPGVEMWADEEGALRAAPRRNRVAEAVAGYYLTHPLHSHPEIDTASLPMYVGDVLFLGVEIDQDGDIDCADLPEEFGTVRQAAEFVAAGLRGHIQSAS